MRTLVIGGTGPTGPMIVGGLVERGHAVTVLHGGVHEADLPEDVEHLHADVHFRDSLAAALGRRTFDLVVAMYGRLRETAVVMAGRTGRLVAVGTAAGLAPSADPRWGTVGRPVIVADADRLTPDPAGPGVLSRAQAASDRLFELAADGAFEATLIGYSILYGPRQVAPEEWCVVRRILDGRRQLVIADGGLKIQQRTYADHAAGAVLLVIDQPDAPAGRYLPVGEQPLYTIRQRIELICRLLGADVELVDLPFDLARPAHYLWGRSAAHAVVDDSAIRALGYRETIPAEEAMARTVSWLVEHRARYAAEWEEQIDDTFDYRGEDELIERWRQAQADLASVHLETRLPAHRYRLPRTPGEPWRRPERRRGSPEASNPGG